MSGALVRCAPLALVLALALGATVSLGAHLSNGFPSESRPFGWPGPANFDNAVAMVRSDLVLTTTLPALLAGVLALRGRDPSRDDVASVAAAYGVGALLVFLAPFVAGGIGAWVAYKASWQGYWAFSVAHGLLALAFFSLAFLCAAVTRRYALAAAGGVWAVFIVLYDNVVEWRMFRQVGYHRLMAGDFPDWFYVSQALSPLTAYRGTLIMWRVEMRDFLEKALLTDAALPWWMTPLPFAALLVVLWALVPLGLALGAWRWHRRRVGAASSSRAVPERA